MSAYRVTVQTPAGNQQLTIWAESKVNAFLQACESLWAVGQLDFRVLATVPVQADN